MPQVGETGLEWLFENFGDRACGSHKELQQFATSESLGLFGRRYRYSVAGTTDTQ